METITRKPFQGVINIIRFNWHFYIIAFILICGLTIANVFLPEAVQWVIPTLIMLILFSIAVSLAISYYIYDYSGIYSLDWLQPLNITAGANLVNIHAGFDETSHALAQRYNLDSRDGAQEERAQVIQSNEGVWECTLVGECSAVCPKHVDPASAIQRYKLKTALHTVKAFVLPRGAR